MKWRALIFILLGCCLMTNTYAETSVALMESVDSLNSMEVEKASRPVWVMITLGLLIMMTASIHAGFPSIIEGDSHFDSWPALLLFVTLGFSTGMLLYLAFPTLYSGKLIDLGPRAAYVLISLAFIVLYVSKVTILYFISHLFGVYRYFKAYIRLLHLTYIHTSLILLLSSLIISLISNEHSYWVGVFSLGIAAALFIFRLVKILFNTIQAYRFPVFYLFVYLCTLEIAPMFILIKIVV